MSAEKAVAGLPASVTGKEVKHVAFVCGCGYGQRGERVKGEPKDVSMGWDGVTTVTKVGDDPLECPNAHHHFAWENPDLAVHGATLAEVETLRSQLSALTQKLKDAGVPV